MDPLELGIQMVVSCRVDTENQAGSSRRVLTTKPLWRFFCPCLPSTKITDTHHHAGLYVGMLGLELRSLGLHNTTWTDPSPQPSHLGFKGDLISILLRTFFPRKRPREDGRLKKQERELGMALF